MENVGEIYIIGLLVTGAIAFLYTFIGGFSFVTFIRNMLCAIFWPIFLPFGLIVIVGSRLFPGKYIEENSEGKTNMD